MTDEQKREMVKAFTPEKIASFKKVCDTKQGWRMLMIDVG
jgi:hypothetical protein